MCDCTFHTKKHKHSTEGRIKTHLTGGGVLHFTLIFCGSNCTYRSQTKEVSTDTDTEKPP